MRHFCLVWDMRFNSAWMRVCLERQWWIVCISSRLKVDVTPPPTLRMKSSVSWNTGSYLPAWNYLCIAFANFSILFRALPFSLPHPLYYRLFVCVFVQACLKLQRWNLCFHKSVEACMLRHRLVGLVVRRPPREQKIPGSNPACDGIFPGSSHTSDLKICTPVAARQAPGIIGSALGLVGPVSVYCDWVR